MADEKICTEDMWTPYKELQNLVERYVTCAQSTNDPQYHELTEALRNHRQNFLSLLKNPPKNSKSRKEIEKGATEGITLPGLGHHVLSKELVDETLIISDMYDLNEYMALDLLCTAQLQIPHHPGLTRGLTAVLLYYDGRKALTSALRTLVQARAGRSWVLDAPATLTKKITEYTKKMEEDGLLERVLSLLEEMDPTKEQDLLQQNRALGGAKHHQTVMRLYNETRQDLADILNLWSAQTSLPVATCFRLLGYLQNRQPESDTNDLGLDRVSLALVMALLNSIDLSALHNREDGEEIVKSMPIIAERGALKELIEKLTTENVNWESSGLRGVAQFAMAIALTSLKSATNLCQNENMSNEEEILLEAALSNKAFHYLARVIFQSEHLHREEFYVRYFHSLIADFITLMPLKVKELRSRADESMRFVQAYQQEGVEPPMNLDNHFEYLMLMIAELYRTDPGKLNLMMDYWCQQQHTENVGSSVSRAPSRQVALFKFVRLAGEILPAGLFVPYLGMIASLASSPQAARQAFNFLKPNGSTVSTTISWDHFFTSLSRYYYNLRQELPPSQDTIYRQRAHPKGITPHEVKGLEAVLRVVQVVARHDEMSRVAICEHPGWKVLPSLVGLVGCAMRIPLKGVLVRTLAALAKSPESSSTIWQSLEAAQILCTIPTTSSYQPRGVQTELEEIESRNEEYPLTRAVLELLDSLTDFPIPRLLGVGQRNPGFDPYLRFIINTVFLRFNTRSYKNPGEKWQVANACMNIFDKLTRRYEPNVEDFVGFRVELQAGESTLVNPEPGYRLMTQLHSNSELLHVILYIIDEGRHLLDSYDSIPGKSDLEECTLHCLRVLERALKLQHRMGQLALVTSANEILTGLSRLLLGVNPRTGKPDHMTNVASYVGYNSWLKAHAYAAIGVVEAVAAEPGADSELLSTFASNPGLALSIRHGFVECLDSDAINDELPDDELPNDSAEQSANCCKDRILLLMMRSIVRPAPNLAHYLLGFDIGKDIRKTIIQQPGILSFPRTCCHSIIGILENSLERGRDKITEASYWFLHILAANDKTSSPILRFLRRNQDLVQRHLAKLPFEGEDRSTELACMSWLLKIAAIELRVSAGNLQNSLVQRLVGDPSEERGLSLPSQKLLMDLLHYIDFQLPLESLKSWEYFDPAQVEMVLGRCSVSVPTTLGGAQLIDVRKLHSVITEELAVTQSSATATQRKLMQQELRAILSYALKRNQGKRLSHATVKFVEGWCQATEILFSIANDQQLPIGQRHSLLLNLSHDLLQKMTSCEALQEIKTLVSGTVLVLLVNLKNSFLVDSGLNESLPSSPTYTTMMKIILGHVLQWILDSGAASQKVRTHLYGALLNFLCVVGREKGAEDQRDSKNATDLEDACVNQLDASFYRLVGSKEKSERFATIQVINGFGDRLMDIVCYNCSGGHDVCKMLALSCLDKILELDTDNAWMIYLTSRGYLRYMIDALLESDNMLRGILQAEPESLRPLYLYEAKMATFCRMASSRLGAESLLENKILSCLSSMCVYDQHPDFQLEEQIAAPSISFVPSVGQRYEQIFMPALYLCDALLTTLGTKNQSCAVQVCSFLQSHRDTVETVLRNAGNRANPIFLRQVACLTGVVARSANIDTYRLLEEEQSMDTDESAACVDSTGMRELRAHLYRLQRLVLALLPKFHRQTPLPSYSPEGRLDIDEQIASEVQIVANVFLYARNQMQHTQMDQRIRNLLFEPVIVGKNRPEPSSRSSVGAPPLGAVLDQLVSATNLLHSEIPNLEAIANRTNGVRDMNTADLKKYLTDEETALDIAKQRIVVEQRFVRKNKVTRRTIKYCSLIIEHGLYILWSHLDYYTVQAYSRQNRLEGIDEGTLGDWRVTIDAMAELKQGLVSVLTDSFMAQLLDTQNEYSTVDRGFIEALIRRIKRLLQFIVTK